RAGAVGVHHALAEAELVQEVGDRPGAGREGLGARVEDEARHLVGADGSPEVVLGLDQGDAQPAGRQVAGGHEPGDAAAHHEGGSGRGPAGGPAVPLRAHGLPPRGVCSSGGSWTEDTRSVSTGGSVPGGTPWPRFTTCPGAVAPPASTSRTCSASTGQGAVSRAGSMLPCSTVDPPSRRLASA